MSGLAPHPQRGFPSAPPTKPFVTSPPCHTDRSEPVARVRARRRATTEGIRVSETELRQYRFTPPPGSMQLILVRHGESAPHIPGTRFDLVDGHGDPALSELGRWQADRVGDRLADE